MDPFETGDPYVEWNEENSAKEDVIPDKEEDTVTVKMSKGNLNRLRRIQKLKNYDELTAIDYAINIAWIVSEKRNSERIRNRR